MWPGVINASGDGNMWLDVNGLALKFDIGTRSSVREYRVGNILKVGFC